MTCQQVEEKIELFAAKELDHDTSKAIEDHLSRCINCTRIHQETIQVISHVNYHYKQTEHVAQTIARVRSQSKIRPLLPISVAATILLTFMIYLILQPRHVPTEIGQRLPAKAKKALADGSTLWAIQDSVIQVEEERLINLMSGEIFIEVASSPKPFVVKTKAADALAKGTSFFIKILKETDMKPLKTAVTVLILSGLVQLQNSVNAVSGTRGESLYAKQDEAPKKQVEDLALRFAKYYKPVKAKIEPNIPSYELPLEISKVFNFKDVVKKLGLKEEDIEKLKANGFVVIPGKPSCDNLQKVYEDIERREVPIFITTDTLLHIFHVFFGDTLKTIEESVFYKDIAAITEAMIGKLEDLDVSKSDNLKQARQKAITYLAIALKTLKPEAKIPESVKEQADIVLEKIAKCEGFWPEQSVSWPLFRYSEDFSLYRPRGHYTQSETLKKYFICMTWLGRMTFILKGGEPYGRADEPFLVSSEESNQQTLAAALLTKIMNETTLPDKRKAQDVWEKIYTVTSFFVGLADDLGPQEYKDALVKVCGSAIDLAALSDQNKLNEFKTEIARHNPPAIYSGTGNQGTFDPSAGPEKLIEALHKSMGFRLMGQRFTPDGYAMGRLVYPTVKEYTGTDWTKTFTAENTVFGIMRGYSRGLDVMALFGSKRAQELIEELGDDQFAHYDETFNELKKDFAKLSDLDWNRNIYWSWLYTLGPLLAEYGEGYQTFMTTSAYRSKSLNTALASWAQLKHDTILYTKNPMEIQTMGIHDETLHYVEPTPEFYARLLALVRMTSNGLLDIMDEKIHRFKGLETLIETLLHISENEVANKKLDKNQVQFLEEFAHDVLTNLLSGFDAKALKSSLIADVFTNPENKKTLQVGTGSLNLMVTCYILPSGKLVLGAGPVLSFYEFKHPMSDRLADEKWSDMLKSKDAPQQPLWTKPYTSTSTTFTTKD